MTHRVVYASILLSAAGAISACQPRDGVGEDARAASTPSPAAPSAPAAVSKSIDTPIAYRCDDGSGLTVTYGAHEATVGLGNGPRVTLPRAESASAGGGDVYVGEALSLQREGDSVQLHQDEGRKVVCKQAAPP